MSAGPENPNLDAGLSRAWYGAPLSEFLDAHPGSSLGELAMNGNFTLVPEQKDAWLAKVGEQALYAKHSKLRFAPGG